ncbi:hypothetical protein WOLCODRAFT_142188 [Wolfiporia cocos MD-104 SS10]|uniref:AB hydrolase-1 domain-containing protein n=1 Tax=Wolfiporia cocos (strain MD-104) TaxID=742152 RepID=A0A2H3JNS7_WOLCO|nr:hypothetical protein WOLCODRAFT_142188 [Wolfiporia cocos MD-104 SS10]
MIGNSLPEYIFIRICISGIRLIAPLSILYTLASLNYGFLLYNKWLGIYAIVEAAFYLLVYLPRCRRLQEVAVHPTPLPKAEREKLFEKCSLHITESNSATGWFFNSSATSIKRENMREWLLWAIFGSHQGNAKEEWTEELDGYLTKLDELSGTKMDPGRNESVSSMRTTIDPVVTVHRPLIWYMVVAIVDTVTVVQMLSGGFKHFDSGSPFKCFPPRWVSVFSRHSPDPELSYWYRPHRSKTKKPVLFLHGIGIGLWPYVSFLLELAAGDPDVGIIAVENLSISMRISPPPLPRQAMLAKLARILDRHGLRSFVLTAHSYGTVLAAHILRDREFSRRVSAVLLVDPIPFLLYLPAVAYNFVYRVPRTASEWQLWYFASRDPDIARALARHFFWVENVLWKEDLEGRECAVVLCGKDQIVDGRQVRRYLTGEEDEHAQFRWRKDGLEVLFYPDLDHSNQFDKAELRRPMVDIVSRFVRLPDSASNSYTS